MDEVPIVAADEGGAEGVAASFTPSFLVLFGLWSFAVAQPLFEVLGEGSAFFVAHEADAVDLFAFTLGVAVVVPLGLSLVVVASAGAGPAIARLVAGILHTLLASLLVVGMFRDWTVAPAIVVGIGLALGAALSLVLARWSRARQLAAWIGVASVAFPLLFLVYSPARSIWLSPGWSAGGSVVAPSSATPVVMVVFDELPLVALLNRDEGIDAGRFPNFAALARTSDWFRNATSVAQLTRYAIPAMLTGRYPPSKVELQPTPLDYPENLFTLVGAALPVYASEWITSLCPGQICRPEASDESRWTRQASMWRDVSAVYLHRVAPSTWRKGLPEIDGVWRDFWPADRDRELTEDTPSPRFDRFLETLQRSPAPALYYMHSKHPHMPWNRLPSGKTYRDPGLASYGYDGGRWDGSAWQTLRAQRRSLLEVGFVDWLLGRLREQLEASGRWDEALILITSDHGGSFERGSGHRLIGPGTANLVEIANVPLFIKWPGQRAGRIDDTNVELIDVMPTVLDVLGVPAPAGLDGTSLARDDRRRGPKRISLSGKRDAGAPLRYKPALLRSRSRIVSEMTDRLGTGDWSSLYGAGPYGELLGRSVRELVGQAAEPVAGPAFSIRNSGQFLRVDLDVTHLPLLVQGEVHSAEEPRDRTLAIAINGRVAGITETWRDQGQTHFMGLVPEEAVAEGGNRVRIYEIRESDGAPVLSPLRPRR